MTPEIQKEYDELRRLDPNIKIAWILDWTGVYYIAWKSRPAIYISRSQLYRRYTWYDLEYYSCTKLLKERLDSVRYYGASYCDTLDRFNITIFNEYSSLKDIII